MPKGLAVVAHSPSMLAATWPPYFTVSKHSRRHRSDILVLHPRSFKLTGPRRGAWGIYTYFWGNFSFLPLILSTRRNIKFLILKSAQGLVGVLSIWRKFDNGRAAPVRETSQWCYRPAFLLCQIYGGGQQETCGGVLILICSYPC